jgi:hypothetical protein
MFGWNFSLEDEWLAHGSEPAAAFAYTRHGAPRFAPSRFAPGSLGSSRELCFGSNPADTSTASPTPGLGHGGIG